MENRGRHPEKDGEGGHIKAGCICPYVSDPLEKCFVASMNSQNIEQAIYYCAINFDRCEIYLKRKSARDRM